MPLDPQAQAIADGMAEHPVPDFSTLPVAAYRAVLAAFPPPPAPDDVLAGIDNGSLQGAAGPLAIRVYRPPGGAPAPLTLFFHGGGFVSCGLDSHDNICRRLAARASTLVVSVDYRLAPEHPFPAAVDDAMAALHWLRAHGKALGADVSRIALAGDSAGGNLAAVTAQQLRLPEIRHQLLLYPVIDSACDAPSHRTLAQAPMLTSEMMRWFWRHYLPSAQTGLDPRASPLRHADLHGLPSATVISAEYDPLRDEAEAYAAAMTRAGVAVTLRRWPGVFHGFASLLGPLDAAREALDFAAASLRQSFAVATPTLSHSRTTP
jgi:acetyl esterase